MVLDNDHSEGSLPWLFDTPLDCLEKLSFRVDLFKEGKKYLLRTNLSLLTLLEIADCCPNVLELAIYALLGLLAGSKAVLQGMEKTLKESWGARAHCNSIAKCQTWSQEAHLFGPLCNLQSTRLKVRDAQHAQRCRDCEIPQLPVPQFGTGRFHIDRTDSRPGLV